MTRKGGRLFALWCTGLATLAFLALTVDSHQQFPSLTNAHNITDEVIHGKDVWHKYNCINCHTLFGEGAYYAPDLTKITQHRGEAYLKAYMKDPSQFYDEHKHRRLMPRQNLSEQEIADLIKFLDWVSKVDNQGWPPRPILVTGASIPGTDHPFAKEPPGARPVGAESSPIAKGEALFRTATPACTACHSIAPGVNMAGPSLAGIGTRAKKIVGAPEYKGKAKDPEGYIRESIVEPSAHLVPGAMYSAGGTSFMPNTYGKDLKPEEIDELVAYLATLQ
ncbi:MAG TPA: c-type cytochrome [Burkholderiales bacterium]|nr:c-type cytochrome [Burkholderiales bacterium]